MPPPKFTTAQAAALFPQLKSETQPGLASTAGGAEAAPSRPRAETSPQYVAKDASQQRAAAPDAAAAAPAPPPAAPAKVDAKVDKAAKKASRRAKRDAESKSREQAHAAELDAKNREIKAMLDKMRLMKASYEQTQTQLRELQQDNELRKSEVEDADRQLSEWRTKCQAESERVRELQSELERAQVVTEAPRGGLLKRRAGDAESDRGKRQRVSESGAHAAAGVAHPLQAHMEQRIGLTPVQNVNMTSLMGKEQQRSMGNRLWQQYRESAGKPEAPIRNWDAAALALSSKGVNAVLSLLCAAANLNESDPRGGKMKVARDHTKEATAKLDEIAARTQALAAAAAGNQRRQVFCKGATLVCERLRILADLQYLAFEKHSHSQVKNHLDKKRAEYNHVRDQWKVPSPASDTSCHDSVQAGTAIAPSPRAHTPSSTPLCTPELSTDNAGVKIAHLEKLNGLCEELVSVSTRFQVTLDRVNAFLSRGREQQGAIAAFLNQDVAALPAGAVRDKAQALAWALTALSAEFGISFRASIDCALATAECLLVLSKLVAVSAPGGRSPAPGGRSPAPGGRSPALAVAGGSAPDRPRSVLSSRPTSGAVRPR